MAFGADIKKLREESGISSEKLAKKIGVNAERLRKWEQNDSTPRHEDQVKIESFFGMTIEEVGKLKSIKKFLIIPNEERNNKEHGEIGKSVLIFDTDAMKVLTEHEQRLLRAEAMLEVYESALAELLSEKKGDFTRKVGELRDAVTKVVNRRFDEFSKKRG